MKTRDRNSRGAVAFFTALVICFIVLPLAGYGVNIGMQRVARRDAQAIADAAAQDAARALGNGTTSQSALQSIAQTTAANTPAYMGGSTPAVTLYTGTLSSTPASDQSLGCGSSHFNSYFTATPSGGTPNAVLVVVRNAVDFPFWGGHGPVCRSSIGTAHPSACLKVGTTALKVAAGDSSAIGLLNGILKQGLGFDLLNGGVGVLGYQGLATANLTVAELIGTGKLGVGTADELVDLPGLTIGDFNAAALSALQNQTPPNTAAITALQAITATIGPVANTPINIGDLVGITQGDGSALGAGVNLLDALTAEALVADGDNAVSVPSLGLNLGLINLSGNLGVIQVPKWNCGPVGKTTATSSQVSLDLKGSLLNVPQIAIPGLTSVGITAGQLEVNVDVAHADAALKAVGCHAGPGGVDTITSDVTSGLLSATVKLPVKVVARLALGPLSVADVTIDLTLSVSNSQAEVNKPNQMLSVPPNDTTPKDIGSGDLQLASLTVDTGSPTVHASLLGIPLDLVTSILNPLLAGVKGVIAGVLTPTLTTLDSLLIGPLQDLLGLEIAGADLFGKDATCANPVIK